MPPIFRTFLFLSPLALAAGAVFLLTRANLARPDPELFTDSWPLAAGDESPVKQTRWADQRWEAKQRIAFALLDGRLTLLQAAAQFRDINAGLPDGPRRLPPPQYTEEEWVCRQVISYIDAELRFHRRAPAQAEEWVSRLEAELREHLRHAGASRLHWGRESAGRPDR
jgi:hypothetical protein